MNHGTLCCFKKYFDLCIIKKIKPSLTPKYQLNIFNQTFNILLVILVFCTDIHSAVSIGKRNYEITVVTLWMRFMRYFQFRTIKMIPWICSFLLIFNNIYSGFGIEVWLIPFKIMKSKSHLEWWICRIYIATRSISGMVWLIFYLPARGASFQIQKLPSTVQCTQTVYIKTSLFRKTD